MQVSDDDVVELPFTQDQFALIRDGEGDIFKHPGIVGDDLADLAVAPGDSLHKPAVLIRQDDGQPVQLPGDSRSSILYHVKTL